MKDLIDVVVNEYWMYEGESFHLVRAMVEGKWYLFGLTTGLENSPGVVAARGNAYLTPTRELAERLRKLVDMKPQTV